MYDFKNCSHVWTESSTCVRCGKPRERDPFAELPDIGPVFIAEFTSDCDHCTSKIKPGDQARYSDGDLIHVSCPQVRKACPVCWLVHGTHQEECE